MLHQDWLRGCKALRLYEMADDKELWQQLLDTYGNASHSAIELAKISFLVPMEPHISLLFRAMVDGLSRIVDVATGQQNKEAKRRDIMANRTILRVRRTILEPPLKAWQAFVISERSMRKRIAKFSRRILNRDCSRAFNQWLAARFGGDRHVDYGQLRGFINRLKNQGLVKSIGTWRAQAERRRGLRAVIVRMKLVHVVKAMNRWQAVARSTAERREYLRGCLAAMSPEGRAKRKAFNEWMPLALARRRLRSSALSLAHRYIRAALNTWVAAAMERAEQLYAVHCAVVSMRNRGARAALNAWISYGEEMHEEKRRLRAALGSFRGDGVRKAYNTWIGLSRARRRMITALGRLTLRSSYRAFARWRDNASQPTRGASRIVATWRADGQMVRKAWNTWLECVEVAWSMRRAVSAISRRGEYKAFSTWAVAVMGRTKRLQAMGGSLASMRNRGIRLALNAWMELAESAANDRRRLLSASKAFTGDVSRKAWYSWLEMTTLQHELARQREGMRSSLKRFIMQSQSRAFESWCMLAKEAAAKQAKMRSCLATLSPEGRAMRKAFNSWGEAAAMLRNLQRAASSLVHRYTRLGWNGWVEFADEQAQRQKAMSKAVASMSQRGERAALNSWVAFAEAAGEQRRLLKSAGAAFKGDGARKAWNQWVHVAAAQSHSRRLAMQAAGRLIHAPMARALLTWQAVVVERSRALDLIAKSSKFFADGTGRAWNQWCSLMASWYRLRRFARRLLRRDLVRAWGQWEESADARRRLQQLSKRALNSDIYHAWLQWSTSLLDMSRMRRFASRLLRRGLAKTFDTWLEQVDAIHQVRKRMKPIARRMLLRGLGAALNKWLDVASEGRRLRAIGRRMMNSGLVRCLNRWSLAAYESARSLRLLKRVASRVASRVKVRVFEAWARATDETKAERETKQRRALNMMRNRGLAAAFYGWIAATKDAAKLRHKYLARWFHALTIKCYLAWSKWARQEVDTRARMRAIAIRIARRTEVIVLQEWHRYVAYAREQLAIAARRWRQAGVWRCFEHLRDHAERQARLKRLASRLLSGVLNGLQLRMFYAWKGQVESQVQRREQTLLHSIQRMRFGALSIVMDQWRQLVMDARRQHHEAEMQAAALLASKQTRAGSESAPGAESAALKAEVAELRRSLDLTRRELKAVSFASAKRYELAIVRAELLTRPPAGSVKESDEKEDEGATTFPSIHASLWRYAAPFVPDEVQERLLKAATLPPPKQTPVSLTEIPPQSSFLRRLNDEAPLTFRPPSPNEPPPGVPAPPTPKAHITRPSPRAQRMVQASTSAPQAVGLKSAKSKEDIVTEVTLRNMQYHAERVGIHGMAACSPA